MHNPYEIDPHPERTSVAGSVGVPEQTPAVVEKGRAAEAVASNSAVSIQNRMYGAQALAPLYRAVLVRPGIQASREEFGQAFNELKRLYRTTLETVYQHLRGGSADVEIRALMAGPVAALVAEVWELADVASTTEIPLPDIERVIEILGQLAMTGDEDFPTPKVAGAEPALLAEAREAIAEVRATCTACAGLLQVWALRPATQRLYSSGRQPADLVRHVRVTLAECADEIVDRLAPDIVPAEQSSVYCAVLEIIGALYRSTLDAQFVELSRRIRHMNEEERREYLDSIPNHVNGHLIERTEELFTVLAPSCYPPLNSVDEPLSGGAQSGLPHSAAAFDNGSVSKPRTSDSGAALSSADPISSRGTRSQQRDQ